MTTIIQLSDTHITAPGRLAYGRVDTHAALARAVAHINALPDRIGPIDAVVVSGDLTDLGTAEEYQAFLAHTATLVPPMFVLPGNHDTRAGMRGAFGDEGYLPPDEGPLDYAQDIGALRVLALDTLTPGAPHGTFDASQVAWLGQTLSEQPDRPTLIFCHHPPFDTGIGHMDQQRLRDGESLLACLRAHPNVKLLACGHVHRAIWTALDGLPCMISPAPAHAVALDTRDNGPSAFALEPGAVLVHRFDTTSGILTSQTSFITAHPGPYPFYDSENRLIT